MTKDRLKDPLEKKHGCLTNDYFVARISAWILTNNMFYITRVDQRQVHHHLGKALL